MKSYEISIDNSKPFLEMIYGQFIVGRLNNKVTKKSVGGKRDIGKVYCFILTII